MKRFLIITSIVFMLIGCSSNKNIVYQHDTIYKNKIEYINKIQFDSIYIHDSVDREVKGDTVRITKFKDKIKYTFIHDTVNKTDTVVVYKYKEVPINKNVRPFFNFKKICILGIIIVILFFTGKYILKFKK